jgi:hypothetical protein
MRRTRGLHSTHVCVGRARDADHLGRADVGERGGCMAIQGGEGDVVKIDEDDL